MVSQGLKPFLCDWEPLYTKFLKIKRFISFKLPAIIWGDTWESIVLYQNVIIWQIGYDVNLFEFFS